MESVDFFDQRLDPPDEPARSRCDECGEDFDNDDLTRTGKPGNYRWLCNECSDNL